MTSWKAHPAELCLVSLTVLVICPYGTLISLIRALLAPFDLYVLRSIGECILLGHQIIFHDASKLACGDLPLQAKNIIQRTLCVTPRQLHTNDKVTNKPQKEKQLGVDHDPEHEDVDDEDVVHPMLLCILWQLVVPHQPGGKQHEQKLLLLMLQE